MANNYRQFGARFASGFAPNLKTAKANGVGANTNIAVSGISLDDVLVTVLAVDFTGGDITDRTAACSITSAGNIQCTAATTGEKLLITYWQTA